MKICLIGVTGHTKYVINGLKNNNTDKIVGIVPGSKGENIEKLYRKLSKKYNLDKFSDYKEMLEELQPDIAAVACHFGDHARIAKEVLKRDIHLFIEKPLATTLDDLQMLEKYYQDSKSEMAAMFGIRYKPWFLTVHKAVKEGLIGEVRLMNAQKSYKLGQRDDFYKQRDTYGGTIPWVGAHAIDWMYWLSGKEFKSVFASHSTKANNGHGELEATGLCHFEFENEVFGSVNIDYLRPGTAPTHDDDRIRIAGDRGVIEILKERVFLINDEISGIRELPLVSKKEIFADFLKSLNGKGECLVSAEDSLIVTRAALKARKSADENSKINI